MKIGISQIILWYSHESLCEHNKVSDESGSLLVRINCHAIDLEENGHGLILIRTSISFIGIKIAPCMQVNLLSHEPAKCMAHINISVKLWPIISLYETLTLDWCSEAVDPVSQSSLVLWQQSPGFQEQPAQKDWRRGNWWILPSQTTRYCWFSHSCIGYNISYTTALPITVIVATYPGRTFQ